MGDQTNEHSLTLVSGVSVQYCIWREPVGKLQAMIEMLFKACPSVQSDSSVSLLSPSLTPSPSLTLVGGAGRSRKDTQPFPLHPYIAWHLFEQCMRMEWSGGGGGGMGTHNPLILPPSPSTSAPETSLRETDSFITV